MYQTALFVKRCSHLLASLKVKDMREVIPVYYTESRLVLWCFTYSMCAGVCASSPSQGLCLTTSRLCVTPESVLQLQSKLLQPHPALFFFIPSLFPSLLHLRRSLRVLYCHIPKNRGHKKTNKAIKWPYARAYKYIASHSLLFYLNVPPSLFFSLIQYISFHSCFISDIISSI